MTQPEHQTRFKLVDSREPGEIRIKLLEVGWEQKQLYSGDYFFVTGNFKKVGITRKAIPDLLQSIGERMSKQLDEMLDFYDYNIILLEGSLRQLDGQILGNNGKLYGWHMVFDYLRRWQDKGFTIELTTSVEHTIARLNHLYALYQKEYSVSAKSREWADDRVLAFPSGCRGKTAMDCLKKFGSLHQIAEASLDELMTIEKVGNKKASLIREHFNRSVKNESKN